ncbi:hypothetical protein SynNOUM97013_02247 [Synechococcus sp. NOUM97013]|nr:hypothetical protein SynNOUM97013_02247 [Synechococcus sp. NOUM97013]
MGNVIWVTDQGRESLACKIKAIPGGRFPVTMAGAPGW